MKTIRLTAKDILYEDDHYIAVHKHQGWPVHQTLDKNRSNLFTALVSFLKQRDKLTKDPYLALHHRLDVDTSGIVLFGKSKESNKVLADIFAGSKATKKYLAIVCGTPNEKEGVLEDFLKKEKIGRIEKMIPTRSGGKKTITKYRLLETKDDLSLVEFELVTGRMHQIRVQSALRNFPCLGDNLYGKNEVNKQYNIEGQLLHAFEFSFYDSLSQKEITITCPAPFSLDNFSRNSNTEEKSYYLFFKPYNVLSQFTKQSKEEQALCDFNLPKDIYPAGRLDKDSEGLLVLSNDGDFIHKISSPSYNKKKTYWVQVEGIPDKSDLDKLSKGVVIKGGYETAPCEVRLLKKVDIPERVPPIRERKTIPTSWLEIIISEGKNRQVRRMTAAIGYPTLRLIRVAIGKVTMPDDLKPGEFKKVSPKDF